MPNRATACGLMESIDSPAPQHRHHPDPIIWTSATPKPCPFMGSGNPVACQKHHRNQTASSSATDYFEIACRRVEAAASLDLFIEPTPKPIQEGFDL